MPASEEQVAHVQASYDDFNERFATLRADGVEDHFAAFYADDAVIEHVDGFPLVGTYRGLDGYRRWFDECFGAYEDVRWTAARMEAVGESVVALAVGRGRAIGDATELEVQLGIVYAVDGGRISGVRIFLGHDRALAAA